MSKYTRLNLLLAIIAFSLMSFTTKDKVVGANLNAHVAVDIIPKASYSFDIHTSDNYKLTVHPLFIVAYDDIKVSELKGKSYKGKKKYKRVLNNFSNIKSPVREIPPVAFNIFWKDLYSKPHFLAHIHHFLFRLTPF